MAAIILYVCILQIWSNQYQCHLCARAMLIFSVSFQFWQMYLQCLQLKQSKTCAAAGLPLAETVVSHSLLMSLHTHCSCVVEMISMSDGSVDQGQTQVWQGSNSFFCITCAHDFLHEPNGAPNLLSFCARLSPGSSWRDWTRSMDHYLISFLCCCCSRLQCLTCSWLSCCIKAGSYSPLWERSGK